ncbi:uncharacterized protein RJT21DRAFT_132206 [Scheffersomyces amazonensis]|uniref:uncharacterized protein n=1 Tax=Scheffersomyces amazonensis TaxID=1078765 RepID=UPI00315D0903
MSKQLHALKRTAPRSGDQYKVGPPFEPSKSTRPIYLCSTNQKVFPIIHARVDRGYDDINGIWIGYKRNYFTLVSSFQIENKSNNIFLTDSFNTINDNGETIQILYFTMKLKAICCEDDKEVPLVQHTAKRDNGPQVPPPEMTVIPSELPDHEIIKQTANIRNGEKVASYNKIFITDIENIEMLEPRSILRTYPNNQVTKVCKYERIQFSSSLNCKRTPTTNKHFRLRIELFGVSTLEEKFMLSYSETPPLIIRGRSPSNYDLKIRAKQTQEAKKAEETKQVKQIKRSQQDKGVIKLPTCSELEASIRTSKKKDLIDYNDAISECRSYKAQYANSISTLIGIPSTIPHSLTNPSFNFQSVSISKQVKEENSNRIIIKALNTNLRGNKLPVAEKLLNYPKLSAKSLQFNAKNYQAFKKSLLLDRENDQSSSNDNISTVGSASSVSSNTGLSYFKSHEIPIDIERSDVLKFPLKNYILETKYKINQLKVHGILVQRSQRRRNISTPTKNYNSSFPKYFSSPIKPSSSDSWDMNCALASPFKNAHLANVFDGELDATVNPKIITNNNC